MYRILRIDNVLPWQVTLKLCRRFAGVAMFSSAGRAIIPRGTFTCTAIAGWWWS